MTRARLQPVNPRRRPPLWIRGKPTDEFLADPRRRCIGKGDLYFDNSPDALAACRTLCAKCPLFQDCTRWALANFESIQFYTVAGMSQHVRARIHAGLVEYYDWRPDWRRATGLAMTYYKRGSGKLAQAKQEMPPCDRCESPVAVTRYGRDRRTGRQRYQCKRCDVRFLGEEL
jgi:hypothetical protein